MEDTKIKEGITFALAFGGFYGSLHESVIDSKIDSDCDDEYPECNYDNVDWGATHDNYCKAWLDMVNSELDLSIEYLNLWSPKFYNFETDEIMAKIDMDEFKKLKEQYLGDEEFVDWLNKASKSRDGFTSFYSGVEEVSGNDQILLAYIFQYIVHVQHQDDFYDCYDLEFEVIYKNEGE